MLLIDDLLLLPISGFRFILRTLERVAKDEYTDDASVKRDLLELQLQLESGEISEKEYLRREAATIQQLREIERRKREMAGLPSEESDQGLIFRNQGQQRSSASVVWYQDRERKK